MRARLPASFPSRVPARVPARVPIRIAPVLILLVVAPLGLSPHPARPSPAPPQTDPSTVQADPAPPPDLAFLAGHWRARVGESIIDEHWFPPEHGSATGMLRWFSPDGSVRMLELINLAPGTAGNTVFTLRHFNGAMMPWESEKNAPMTGVVESHAPGRLVVRLTGNAGETDTMTYEKTGGETMRVTIAFEVNSSRDPIVIDFEKHR